MKRTQKKEARKRRKNGRSVQELLGIRRFTRYGLLTDDGELIFFEIQPVNLAVLSEVNAGLKIRHLQEVLSMHPELEIVCADAYACFDTNKAYLENRYHEEHNAKVCELLAADEEMLDAMQAEIASARQFILLLRCRKKPPEQVFQEVNRVQKTITERGFEVRRMERGDLKRFLAMYLGTGLYGELMPDEDGGQYKQKEYPKETEADEPLFFLGERSKDET